MTAIVRCIPLDERIQVGFYGTDQEVLQQLREAEEGYQFSRRWLSWQSPDIPTFQLETLEQLGKKKSKLISPRCETQNASAMQNSVLRNLWKG